MSSGKGISDAVRNAIGDWITDDVISTLWSDFKNEGGISRSAFGARLRMDAFWVRRVRRGHSQGWERDYDCKVFPKGTVGLRVHTNQEDTHIKFVTFKVGDRYVGGGKVHVPSMLVSQAGRKASIQNGKTPTFTPFSQAELEKLNTQRQFGESALLDMMMEERI